MEHGGLGFARYPCRCSDDSRIRYTDFYDDLSLKHIIESKAGKTLLATLTMMMLLLMMMMMMMIPASYTLICKS